ncbi:hypothetical protein [Psychrobacter lutiphocae]|uniref:hypothetical protein n=1 Tax=Psychrobacter lutiphocae TaxID=540500 RepID=UPI00035E0A12|nr:hypothetical protein [Psychrobacter lutiphocae]
MATASIINLGFLPTYHSTISPHKLSHLIASTTGLRYVIDTQLKQFDYKATANLTQPLLNISNQNTAGANPALPSISALENRL